MRVKAVLVGCLVCILLVTGCASKNKPFDFRGVYWGNNQKTVEKSEETEYVFASEELMMFSADVDGKPAEIYYSFQNNELVEGEVKFVIGDRILREIVEDYALVADRLKEFYGEPVNSDALVWLDDDEAYKPDPEWVSILNHRLMYRLAWETETTYVVFELECADETHINYFYHAYELSHRP